MIRRSFKQRLPFQGTETVVFSKIDAYGAVANSTIGVNLGILDGVLA